ncbi:MAG: hypothetical protein R3B52_03090 [Candidatus Paceibacterota bacterium]
MPSVNQNHRCARRGTTDHFYYEIPDAGAREWMILLSSLFFGFLAIWAHALVVSSLVSPGLRKIFAGFDSGLSSSVLVVAGIVFLYFISWRPSRAGSFVLLAEAFLGSTFLVLAAGIFTFIPKVHLLPSLFSMGYLVLTWAMLYVQGQKVPAKHYGVHKRLSNITGWLAPKGDKYLVNPADRLKPINEETNTESVPMEIDVAGLAGCALRFFANFRPDSRNFNAEGENRYFMLSPMAVMVGIVKAILPYIRFAAASVDSVQTFKHNEPYISKMLRFVVETNVVPHQDAGILASLGATRPVSFDEIMQFYKTYEVELDSIFETEGKTRSHIEDEFGIEFTAAGVGIEDVKEPKELADAFLRSEIAKQDQLAAVELGKVDPVHLDRLLLSSGRGSYSRIDVNGSGGSDLGDKLVAAADISKKGGGK